MQKLEEVKLEILVVFKLEMDSLLVTYHEWFIHKWHAIMLWSESCDYHVRKGGEICEYVIVCAHDGSGIFFKSMVRYVALFRELPNPYIILNVRSNRESSLMVSNC